MSVLLGGLRKGGSLGRLLQVWQRGLVVSPRVRCEAEDSEEAAPVKEVDPAKDRSRVIPVETSIKYLQSEAYKTTYGDDPVWKNYRRNFKGAFPPPKTRKTCIRQKVISCGSPCPICRDEYLVLDSRNISLLKQFISSHNGAILSTKTTNLCQRRQREMVVAVEQARDAGRLTFDVPLRLYHYPDYHPPASATCSTTMPSSDTHESHPH